MQSLEWITDRSRFAAIAPEWDRLAVEQRTPFLSFAWIDAWYRAFAADDVLVAALWRDGELVGGVPLVAGWRRWIGAANEHSPEFGLLAVDAQARAQLVDSMLARSIVLTLPSLAEDEPALAMLLETARRRRRQTWVETGSAFLVDTTGSVERYRAGMSAKTLSELGRLRRKAQREHALEVMPLGEVVDLERQLARALAVEASGWKGRAGSAIVSSPDTEQFYRDVAGAFHAWGKLRISELSLDDEPAAMALSIVHRRRLFTIKIGYDERHRRLGPGLVLLIAMIERCFELGLDAYEFCGPEEEYERRFATAERAHHRVQISRRDPLSLTRYGYRRYLEPRLRTAYKRARHAGIPDPRAALRRHRASA